MTFKELYSLYYIEEEIKEYKLKIAELREMAESITPTYTGLPSGSGQTSDKVGNGATSIVAYTEMLNKAIWQREEQARRINEYIIGIDDAQLRLIMYLRFIKRMSWQQVANRIGGGNTADGVRMRCNRFLRQNKKVVRFVRSKSNIM